MAEKIVEVPSIISVRDLAARVKMPLYREVADIIIETSRQSVQTLVRQLEKQLPGT